MLEHTSDFEMSVPYGKICGKIWNERDRPIDSSTERIIALHGWQDNCGSFDTLIPKLPTNYYIVAIDFPGHGLSSHLPPGCPYNDVIFVIEVERIIHTLGWKDKPFTILGHSMGAAIGIFYACLYPKLVRRIVALDMIKPLTFPTTKLAQKTREGIQSFLDLEAKCTVSGDGQQHNDGLHSSVPLYDQKQAAEKLITAHSVFGKITPEGAEYLLKRGSKLAPNNPEKVYFTRDNRLKAMLFQRMDNDGLIHYFSQLESELLIIKAENGVKLDPEEVSQRYIELYREKCRLFDFVQVPGGHHVHLCNPENIYHIIVDFIEKSQQQQKSPKSQQQQNENGNSIQSNGTTNGQEKCPPVRS